MTAIHDRITAILRNTPDLMSHRFIDTDGEFSVKIHSAEEVAQHVAEVLVRELGTAYVVVGGLPCEQWVDRVSLDEEAAWAYVRTKGELRLDYDVLDMDIST